MTKKPRWSVWGEKSSVAKKLKLPIVKDVGFVGEHDFFGVLPMFLQGTAPELQQRVGDTQMVRRASYCWKV